jgi:PEP-CTERM motif-containing protein
MKTKSLRSRKSPAISDSRIRRGKVAAISSSRWTAYATAGAASALACVATAEGEIHYSGLINQSFNAQSLPPGSGVSAYFQLDQPGNSLNPVHIRRLAPNSAQGFATFFVYGNLPAIAGFSANGYAYASKLSFGQAVSAAPFLATNVPGPVPAAQGVLAFGSGFTNSQWLDAGIGFIGFRFDNGSGPQYGWARIVMDGAPVNSFTFVDFAWADLGDSISAGQIPEPGSLALLALGGAGLLAWRKRRAKAAAQQ